LLVRIKNKSLLGLKETLVPSKGKRVSVEAMRP
jgi:hypothetical protein